MLGKDETGKILTLNKNSTKEGPETWLSVYWIQKFYYQL